MHGLPVVRIALHSLARNKVRSFLTALGVAFGVGAVVAMLSIGEGARREASEQVDLLGANTVFISNSWASWAEGKTEGLLVRDARALGSLDFVAGWAALRRFESAVVEARARRVKCEIIACTPGFAEAVNLGVERGRFFDAGDCDNRAGVCILGSSLKRAVFAFEDAVGQQVKAGDLWLTVIGVAEYKKTGGSRVQGLKVPHYNAQMFVPLGLAAYLEKRTDRGPRPEDSIDEVILAVGSSREVLGAASVAERVLERLHRAGQDYKIVVPQELLAQSRKTQRTFNIVMGAIAGVSLLVGGIGIMNIMLANVLERRHEIGVRRASGATTHAVLTQFLAEAVVLSLVGCAVGIALGAGLSGAVAEYARWKTAVSWLHILAAISVAAAVGILSGYYPARQAARIDPGEALRYE